VETPPGYPFRFACRRSGNCCAQPEGMVRVGPADVARIAAHLALPEPGFRSRFLAATGDRLKEGLGGRCVFLEDGGEARCSIYAVRPERCRSWPFWPELRDSPEELRRACRMCPGIEAGGDAPGPA
jgi:hypothetical protein